MTYLSKCSLSVRAQLNSSASAPPIRWFIHGFLLSAILLVNGCGKSPTPAPASQSAIGNRQSAILTLHWLGKKRLTAESNATNFVSIWNMPESVRLEGQTLDKLATAPWRLLTTATPLSNAPSALLRPLLDDLVQEESYLEISAATNQPAEIVLAIKLPPDRLALWRSNLPAIFESLQPSTFNLQPVTHTNGWTLLSIHSSNHPSIHQSTGLASRLSTTSLPFTPEATNFWISGRADLSALSHIAGWNIRSNTQLPVCEFSASGESGNVRTHATLTFPSKAPIELEPWNIPTNLVHDPLGGFMSIRGLRPLLRSFQLWNETKFGETPNQATFWAQEGNPALRFFAFPTQQASNRMNLLSDYLLKEINPMMAVFPNTTNVPIGLFEQIPGSQRLRWRGIPYIMPNLNLISTDSGAFVVGGLFQNRITNNPAPESLLSQFKNDSNIILYNWEQTKSTAYPWIQMSQAARFVFGRNRLSLTNNLSLPWIVAISTNLNVSGTTIRLASSDSITFSRSSTIGLTGIEIHLLAEWLESPTFPKGLFWLSPPFKSRAP